MPSRLVLVKMFVETKVPHVLSGGFQNKVSDLTQSNSGALT